MRWHGHRRAFGRVQDLVTGVAGGRAQARVVLTLSGVLALSGADTGTVSATADNLEHAFRIGNTQIGVLVSVVALVGALFTIPAGVLVGDHADVPVAAAGAYGPRRGHGGRRPGTGVANR